MKENSSSGKAHELGAEAASDGAGKEQEEGRVDEEEPRCTQEAGSSKSAEREEVIRELEEWRERRENLGAESRVGEAGSSRSPARSRTATQAALEMLQKSPHSLCCPRLS